MRVEIATLGTWPPLVIENADWLAEAFFAVDPSGKPGGFDDKARETAPIRIESKDVDAINRTMRARSPQKAWAAVRVLDALLWGSHPASWIAPLAPILARWRQESI